MLCDSVNNSGGVFKFLCLTLLLSAWPAGNFSARVLSPHNLNCSEQLPRTVYQEVNTETYLYAVVKNLKYCDLNMIFSVAQ